MAENSPYFDAIVAHRSMRLETDAALAGQTLLSAESCGEFGVSDSALPYIEEHFADFLRDLRFLSNEDQELLLAYFVLAKTQNQLAPLHASTQTQTSTRIRLGLKKLMLFKLIGRPTAEAIRPILVRNSCENLLPHSMADVIELYERTRSFDAVAENFRLHRPAVRRTMREVAQRLLDAPDALSVALGAHVFELVDKASATGRGLSEREAAKQVECIYVRTSPVHGQFRIDVTDPGFSEMFASRAVL